MGNKNRNHRRHRETHTPSPPLGIKGTADAAQSDEHIVPAITRLNTGNNYNYKSSTYKLLAPNLPNASKEPFSTIAILACLTAVSKFVDVILVIFVPAAIARIALTRAALPDDHRVGIRAYGVLTAERGAPVGHADRGEPWQHPRSSLQVAR